MQESYAKITKMENSVDISCVYPQSKIYNRYDNKSKTSTKELSFIKSIRENGLVHPIIVREDVNGNYEMFAGYRRYNAWHALILENEESDAYNNIPAVIYSTETTDIDMLAIDIAENEDRLDLSMIEKIESKVSLLPYFFSSQKEYKDENIEHGHEILRLWQKYTRSTSGNSESIHKIVEITNCENPASAINFFFNRINEKERTFIDNAFIVMNSNKKIRSLIRNRNVSLRHARSITTMKSEVDKTNLIRLIENEKMSYKDIEQYIRDSNIKAQPEKWRLSTSKHFTNQLNLFKTKIKKDLSHEKTMKIESHLNCIEDILTQR